MAQPVIVQIMAILHHALLFSEPPDNPLITAASARTRPTPGIHGCIWRSAPVPRSVWFEHRAQARRRDWLQAIGAW